MNEISHADAVKLFSIWELQHKKVAVLGFSAELSISSRNGQVTFVWTTWCSLRLEKMAFCVCFCAVPHSARRTKQIYRPIPAIGLPDSRKASNCDLRVQKCSASFSRQSARGLRERRPKMELLDILPGRAIVAFREGE
jgi:hypothetical protein